MVKIPIWKSKITNPHWNNPYRGYVLFAMRDMKDLDMWDYETFYHHKEDWNNATWDEKCMLKTDYYNAEKTNDFIELEKEPISYPIILENHIRKIW